eukprot:1664076-Prymnesium_polylepis.1
MYHPCVLGSVMRSYDRFTLAMARSSAARTTRLRTTCATACTRRRRTRGTSTASSSRRDA